MASTSSTNQSSPNKPWELSLYELNREPQAVIDDDSEIRLSPRTLHNELMCPICLDLLRKTMTTKECLHRFCSECIITALRSGNKECPTCRKKLASKRSLRPDPNFDLIIETLYPSREEYEALQIMAMEKLNKSQSQAALVNSIREGIKVQNQTRFQRTNKRAQTENGEVGAEGEADPSTSTPTSTPAKSKKTAKAVAEDNASSSARRTIDDVELAFKPHPNEAESVIGKYFTEDLKRYLKITPDATVDDISKYVMEKASKDQGSAISHLRLRFNVASRINSGELALVSDKDSLQSIIDTHLSQGNNTLEFYYISKKS